MNITFKIMMRTKAKPMIVWRRYCRRLLEQTIPLRMLPIIAVACALMSTAGFAQDRSQRTASVRGIVLDENNQPVPMATVQVTSTALSSRTTSDGKFSIQNIVAGTVVLSARALGFGAANASIALKSGESVEVEIILRRNSLDTSRVVGMTSLRAEYEERRAKNMGFVLDSARLTRPDFVSALNNLPLTRVRRDGFGADIRLRNLSGTGTCTPIAFLDGRLADLRVLTSRPPSEFRAIELLPYEQTPGKYQGRVGCGSMLFWSHKVAW